MMNKAQGMKADNISFDLEDAVEPDSKDAARSQLQIVLQAIAKNGRPSGIGEVAVRINPLSSEFNDKDMAALQSCADAIDALVVPKIASASDMRIIAQRLTDIESRRRPPSSSKGLASSKSIRVLALIESARAVMDLREICSATARLSGLIFGAEDFANDLSMTRTPSLTEFLYARSAIVTAARAFEVPSVIDLVRTDFRSSDAEQQLRDECRSGKDLGFTGKQCIHPSQLETIQASFAPAEDEVRWASRILQASEEARFRKSGAFTVDGKMVDAPVIKKASAILSQAEKCGIDISAVEG
jgi:citrate lyase subunit beta-like protein